MASTLPAPVLDPAPETLAAPPAPAEISAAIQSMAAAPVPVESFSLEELEQFRGDDAAAARTIGKILSTLFLYTLIIMSVVVWWTLKTMMQ